MINSSRRQPQASHNEFTELESKLHPLITETRAAIGSVAKALRREVKPLIKGKARPIYAGSIGFQGPHESSILPISEHNPLPGFSTLTAEEVVIVSWKLGWLRKNITPVVQLNFDDSLQRKFRNVLSLTHNRYMQVGIKDSGLALFDYGTEHTETMPWEYAYGRYTDVNDLKQAYTNSNINALGVASLTATGVIKANDIDPDKIPLPSLTDLFQEWELEAGIINGIDNSKAPALSGVQGASARPIYTRTTIRHLVRLRELESSSPI